MSIFKKLLKCLVVATVITPAAVAPAVAGCCGAFPVENGGNNVLKFNGSVSGGGSLQTTDTVTNTSMQLIATEVATINQDASDAPVITGGASDGGSGQCSGDVM